jgi:hypothetical protein
MLLIIRCRYVVIVAVTQDGVTIVVLPPLKAARP